MQISHFASGIGKVHSISCCLEKAKWHHTAIFHFLDTINVWITLLMLLTSRWFLSDQTLKATDFTCALYCLVGWVQLSSCFCMFKREVNPTVALNSQQYYTSNPSLMRIHRALWRPYGKGQSIFIACFISSQRKNTAGKKWQKLMFGSHRENLYQATFPAEFWDASHFILFPKSLFPLGSLQSTTECEHW